MEILECGDPAPLLHGVTYCTQEARMISHPPAGKAKRRRVAALQNSALSPLHAIKYLITPQRWLAHSSEFRVRERTIVNLFVQKEVNTGA
jgi:hypothetical protein